MTAQSFFVCLYFIPGVKSKKAPVPERRAGAIFEGCLWDGTEVPPFKMGLCARDP